MFGPSTSIYPGGLPEGRPAASQVPRTAGSSTASWCRGVWPGSGDVWAVEADPALPRRLDVGLLASIIELRDGLIVRETNYYAPFTPAPEWRSQWVVPLPEDG